MGLDVGGFRAEKFFDPFDREGFHFIDEFAAVVVTFAGISFGIFVGQHGTLCRTDGPGGEVFAGDQFDAVALAFGFGVDDFGDGGIGVYIAQSAAHLRAWLDANVDDAVAQEYISGNEYEVIWVRRPGRKDGQILSVIQKDFVRVKGDGERKLEDLIWADDHGVCNGKLFSKQNFRKADMVLEPGKYYPLAPTGSRIRGARFIARPELRAGTLSKAIDALADACGEVHYVCLDIRAASDEALSNGEAIRITSVKGAGAISSALYDGYVRMGKAYSVIYKQMNFCFSVGAELRDDHHVRAGISAWKLFEIWGTARGRSDNYVKEPAE